MNRGSNRVLKFVLGALALLSLLGMMFTATAVVGVAWLAGPSISFANTPQLVQQIRTIPSVVDTAPSVVDTATDIQPRDMDLVSTGLQVTTRLSVATPITHEAVTIYPVVDSRPPLKVGEHVLLAEAMAAGTVSVSEVDAGGSVPNLMIHNKGDQDLLITAGEVLRGGKQDRVATDDVLIKPSDEPVALNVNCVEQGRWSGTGQGGGGAGLGGLGPLIGGPQIGAVFGYGGRGETSLKKVLQENEDQGDTWSTVNTLNRAKQAKLAESHHAEKEVAALAPASGTYMASLGSKAVQAETQATVTALEAGLASSSTVTGVVVSVNGKFVSAEVFGHPRLFQKGMKSLLESVAMDAMSRTGKETDAISSPSAEAAADFLRAALAGQHEETEAAGDAIQRSLKADVGTTHQLVAEDGTLIHMNVYADQ